MDSFIAWAATGLTILAALMTASNLGSRITGYGFAVFTVGSIAWMATAVMTSQPALMWTNAVLFLLNLFGVWRWLGREARIEEGGRVAQERSEATPGEALFPASLFGRAKITGAGGAELGNGVDAMIGSASGRVAYVVVSDGGVAGVGEELRRIDWSDARVEGDRLMINLTADQFSHRTVLTKDQWPGR